MPDRVHGHSAALTRHSNGTFGNFDTCVEAETSARIGAGGSPAGASVAVYKLVAVHAQWVPPQPNPELRRFIPDEDLS